MQPSPSLADWTALSGLLDRALDLPRDERTRYIDGLVDVKRTLQDRLRALLSRTESSESAFLRTIPKLEPATFEKDELTPPEAVGPYRISHRIGQGGMGTVWLAHRTDVMVNRPVALKLARDAWQRTSFSDRIVAEREILAALNHPNIARLYDAGITDRGQPYLALEYVDGRPIDEHVRDKQLPLRDRLRLFVLIARAVAHAHAHLVVHQDLKPSNILVTCDGDVKLLDFGIAELCNRRVQTPGAPAPPRPLTPAYASPEQRAGAAPSVAADVYSSGVVLHELLTGARPSADEPRRAPSDIALDPAIRRTLRGDLDAIVLKALAPLAGDRYATMSDLADDVERSLQHQPVKARADRVSYRVAKFARRHTVAVVSMALALTAVVTGSALAVWQRHVALSERTEAIEVRDFLAALLQNASPYSGSDRTLSAVDWLKQVKAGIDRRLDARPAVRVELLNLVGSSLTTLQDTDGAELTLEQAVEEGLSRLGPEHPQTLRARVLMTAVNRFRGRAKEMRSELDSLLPVLRARRRELPEDLTIALKNRAHLEIDAGRYEAADSAAQEAVEVAESLLGNMHAETVAAVLTRAYAYQFTRSTKEALRAAEDGNRRALALFGHLDKHPRTIESRLLLGRALGENGEWPAAVAQLTKAVQEASDVFGPSSRMAGLYLVQLAQYQLEMGEIDEALENSRRAIDIVGRHAQRRSFRYAAAVHHHGAALLAARRAKDALADLTFASDTVSQVLPANHEITRGYAADLAMAIARAGDPERAQRLLERLVPAPNVAPDGAARHALYAMGVAARLRGDSTAALACLDRALQATPADRRANVRRMLILGEIGLARLDLGRAAPAAAALEQALELARTSLAGETPDSADILAGLDRARRHVS